MRREGGELAIVKRSGWHAQRCEGARGGGMSGVCPTWKRPKRSGSAAHKLAERAHHAVGASNALHLLVARALEERERLLELKASWGWP